ncbi:CehA/McbA family metallohydrolase [Candidatus Gracilibacteria bacterium]|nr:CehA/McbA family metallohydrolase [Candidatus Gracilibacteria bacterium]
MKHFAFCYPGAIHIHSRYSDGSGSIPAIAAAAREAGLRWIVVTDHDTLAGKPFEGWIDDVLVIVGYEITPARNHFLALNIDTVVDNELAPQEYIDEVYARGGFGIIAHPDERVANRFKANYRWEDWTIDGPTRRDGRAMGIELWNVMSDWGEHMTERNKYLNFFFARLGLNGPSPATLAWWDRLNMAGKHTFGIGGIDVHAFKQPVPWGEVEVFSYRWMFGTLTNYALLDRPLSSDALSARAQILAAIGGGRSYFINRLDGAAPALRFTINGSLAGATIGDTLRLNGTPATVVADVGSDALLRLVCNGHVLCSAPRALRQTITEAGVYRLEAYWGGKPWLFTNPIFVARGSVRGGA